MKLAATVGGKTESADVTGGDGRYRVRVGDHVWDVDARFVTPATCSLLVDGASYVADVTDGDGAYTVAVEGETYTIEVDEHIRHMIRTRGAGTAAAGGQIVKAPMPGKVSHVAVARGDHVRPGDTLVVIEAMKMENELKAAAAGIVTDVRVTAGQPVNPGDVLIVIEPDA